MMLISVAGNGCNRQIAESLIEESISVGLGWPTRSRATRAFTRT